MTQDKEVEDYFHHQLVCRFCGNTWWGLHCPHDGYQNPCPGCDKPPIPIKGNCECELVIPMDVAEAHYRKKFVEELLEKMPEANPEEWAGNQPQVAWTLGYKNALKQVNQLIEEINAPKGKTNV